MERTRREWLRRLLELSSGGQTPSDLAKALADERDVRMSPSEVADEIDHIAQSLEHEDGDMLVAPPECRQCGFDGFDKPLNVPSKCPECRSTAVLEPRFKIAEADA